jgi:hypothetical protein
MKQNGKKQSVELSPTLKVGNVNVFSTGNIREEMSTGYVLGNLLKAVRFDHIKGIDDTKNSQPSSYMGQQQNNR